MLFMDFSRCCERLEAIAGRLEMIDIISKELPGLTDEELPVFVRFVMGRIFSDWSSRKLGIGPNLLYEAVGSVAGVPKEQVVEKINKTGDVGQAVEELLAVKSQMTFFHEDLDLVHVYSSLIGIAEQEGKKSQREKLLAARQAARECPPARGALPCPDHARGTPDRCGRREACGRRSRKAFAVDSALVEHAMQALNDMGEVARLAKRGPDALARCPHHPVPPGPDDARPAGLHRGNDQRTRGDRGGVQVPTAPGSSSIRKATGPGSTPAGSKMSPRPCRT